MSEQSQLRIERFAAEIVDGVPSARTTDFNLAVSRGFHEGAQEGEALVVLARLSVEDSSEQAAVYDDALVAPSLHAGKPVATFASFPGTLNMGHGTLMPARQITAVTVSPTHRRRGILRQLMTEDLRAAKEAGLPAAILTASEATIYGRFGFGAVTEGAKFSLKCIRGAAMRAERTGDVLAVDPAAQEETITRLFTEAHQGTFGSVSHSRFDIGNARGLWEDYDDLTPIKNLRAAVHRDASGTIDGYVSYEFSGWKSKSATLSIGQMITLNGAARRELIAYLADHDLIEEITGTGPLDDFLRTSLENIRDYKIVRASDHLWLRILDIPAVLTSRSYQSDGKVSLSITDDLLLTNGAWEIIVQDGVARVHRAPADKKVDATLDIRDLSPLVMGTRSASHLFHAGVLKAHDQAALEVLDSLFATSEVPYCQAAF